MKYTDIVNKAKTIKNGVEKEYKLKASTPVYYMAKIILNKSKKEIPKIKIDMASNGNGDYISNQAYKTTYLDMAKRLTEYVEANGQLPNNIKAKLDNKTYYVKVRDYVYMFSRILIYYDENGELPKYANINSKSFTKPEEYPNKVYGLWVKYIKTKPKYLDDVCDYVRDHFNYQFYFDDEKSNEQVLATRAGNCTDLLQMLCNMAEAMDYEWKVIHTQCAQSGTGHVYGKFRKKGTNDWFIRDIACIADNSTYCVWCNVDTGAGYLLATNPSWFIQNMYR